MRIALHACCGPCLLEPIEALRSRGEVVVYYHNPNIHPADEYERRRDTLLAYADEQGIEVVESAYDPASWMRDAGRHGDERAERCRACYRLRLGQTARWAAENGFDAIATTLTVSPYQDIGAIEHEAREAAAMWGLEYVGEDFRERYSEATRRSRELGMYRQNYCGCVLSDVEARRERAERKRQRLQRRDG